MQLSSSQNAAPKAKPHGCMCPMHPFQIMSYIIFFIYAYTFYFIELITLQSPIYLPYLLGIIYGILFLLVATTALVATFIDPTDSTIALERSKKLRKYFYKIQS